jgi:negative regulator of flagellin synthesis FlgM
MAIERNNDAKKTSSGRVGNTMKVTGRTTQNGVRNPLNETSEKKIATGSASESSRTKGSDRIELSVNRNEVEKLTSTIAAMPGANSEKIESLKQRIADGTYTVSSQDVAEKMLRSMGIQPAGGDEK